MPLLADAVSVPSFVRSSVKATSHADADCRPPYGDDQSLVLFPERLLICDVRFGVRLLSLPGTSSIDPALPAPITEHASTTHQPG